MLVLTRCLHHTPESVALGLGMGDRCSEYGHTTLVTRTINIVYMWVGLIRIQGAFYHVSVMFDQVAETGIVIGPQSGLVAFGRYATSWGHLLMVWLWQLGVEKLAIEQHSCGCSRVLAGFMFLNDTPVIGLGC